MTKKDQQRGKRVLRLRHIRTAMQVAKALGVDRKNSILFPAVARALGQRYVPGKVAGYELVMKYAWENGLVSDAVQPRVCSAPAKVATNAFLMSFEWRQLRMIVLKKRGARCECCGASPKDGTTVLNVDHVKPRKLFPELALTEGNLQVLCGPCNHGKGNWDQTDWREPAVDSVPFCGPMWWPTES